MLASQHTVSRAAGLAYLVVVVTGIFSLAYVPSRIAASGDPKATINNIVVLEPLFRYGIASFLVNQIAFLLLTLLLFVLLRRVNHRVAVVMVTFAVASVPIALVSVTHRLNALSVLTDPRLRSLYSPDQLQAAAMLSLEAYRNGLLVTKFFWGLWLFPLGFLVLRSRFLPKILGIFLMVGCAGYILYVFGELLVPAFSGTTASRYVLLPAAVGEIGTCLWLLLIGGRASRKVRPND